MASVVYVACFQLAFAQNIASMPNADTGKEVDFWSRVEPGFFREVEATLLNAEQASPRARSIMQTLEENGGRGRYEQIIVKEPVEVIRVLSPPSNPIYGSAFDEVFRELQSYGISIRFATHLWSFIMPGAVFSSLNEFGPDARIFLVISPGIGNTVLRHELQHVRDRFHYSEFQSALPKVPPRLMHLLEKREAGEALDERDKKVLEAAFRVMRSLEELRASEASLASLFTAQGLREIADSETWLINILAIYNELFLASIYNADLLYNLWQSDLSSEWVLAFKPVFYLVMAMIIYYAFHVVVASSFRAIKSVAKPLGQCPLAIRSLFAK